MDAVLPFDIVYEILLHLSVKTLNKFRCVCKPWNTLISQPNFQHYYYCRRRENPLLLLLRRRVGVEDLHLTTCSRLTFLKKYSKTVPGLNLNSCFLSIQSSNGLVCIESGIGPVVLCNPSTEEVLTLPPAQGFEYIGCIGFGYAASVDEYKVVKFYYSNSNCCRVFSLSARVWREARSPPVNTVICGCRAPFFKGSLHVLLYDCFADNGYSLAAFDIEAEEYKVIPIGYTQNIAI